MLMHWVRYVYSQTILSGEPTVVCCRKDHKILFPAASEYFHDWEDLQDNDKRWRTAKDPAFKAYTTRLRDLLSLRYPGARIIEPSQDCEDGAIHAFRPNPSDAAQATEAPKVVIAPRHRKHGAHRNYLYWPQVAAYASSICPVGLVGAKATSIDIEGVPEHFKAWNHENDLDVTVSWMQRARMVITSDSGMAHLAILCGAKLFVIYDEPGLEAGKSEWPWTFEHMHDNSIAPCQAIPYGWGNPNIVYEWISRVLQ